MRFSPYLEIFQWSLMPSGFAFWAWGHPFKKGARSTEPFWEKERTTICSKGDGSSEWAFWRLDFNRLLRKEILFRWRVDIDFEECSMQPSRPQNSSLRRTPMSRWCNRKPKRYLLRKAYSPRMSSGYGEGGKPEMKREFKVRAKRRMSEKKRYRYYAEDGILLRGCINKKKAIMKPSDKPYCRWSERCICLWWV